MKMKSLFCFMSVLGMSVFASCNRPSTSVVRSNSEQDVSLSEIVDTVPKVGGDRDEHGCLTSGGYVWSELKQDCLRTFEIGHRLNPVDVARGEAVLSAFIIFSDDKLRAEVFMPGDHDNVILDRRESSVYEKEKYKFDENTYILSIDGEEKYKGNLTAE